MADIQALTQKEEMAAAQEFAGLHWRPGVLDLKSQHLIAWSAALLTDCQP